MVKILKTNSGFYLAFNDDVSLTEDEIRSYKAASFSDPKVHHDLGEFRKKFPKANSTLTTALMMEITCNIPKIEKNINELADISDFRKRVLETAQRTGRKHCYTHYTIKTSDLPSDYNSCPIPLYRKEEYYFPKYDSKKRCYICCNEYGSEININSLRAAFDFKKMEVTVYDKVFFFMPQEAEAIKKINQLALKQPVENILKQQTPQIRALYNFYLDISKHYLDKNQKLYSVSHELQHAQTQQRINRRRQQPNHAELSPTNTYRFDEDYEKAAHLRETHLAIAKFFQKGGDISVFPEKCQWLVNKIKNRSFEEQKQILLNNNYIVNGNIQNWNRNYAQDYTEQRCSLTCDYTWDASVLRMEDGDEEYLARRSCAYTMDVYNPQTGKMEKQDLSKFIQIPTIIRDNERKNTDLYESIRRQRLNDLKKNGIDLKLILSLFNETYQEPFKIRSPQNLREQIIERGFSFKSKNREGNSVLIEVKKHPLPDRPNCISLSSSLNGKPIFNYILDRDKQEYNLYHFNSGKKYSNVANTKHPPLPNIAEKQIKKYLDEASREITKKIILLCSDKDKHK